MFYTLRSGNIDMIVNSMKSQTYKNWELLLVDDYPYRDFNKVRAFCDERGVKMAWHGKSKQKCYPDTPYNQINAVNTGLLHSTGDIILTVTDFSWLRPDALEKWNELYKLYGDDFCATGIGKIWDKPDFQPIVDDIGVTKEEMTEFPMPGWKEMSMWIPETWEMFYWTMPRKYLRTINALDERSDYWREWPVYNFMQQGALHDLKIAVDGTNVVDILNHRSWIPKSAWHINYIRKSVAGKDINDEDLRPAKMFKADKRSPNCFEFQ